MREQQAKDFWSAYLKLILRKGQETTIVNPFEEFRDSVAKGGYESVSDEEYANIYDQVEELSVFWQQRPKESVAHIVIEALSRTHLYEDEIQDIAGILAEASERTNYTQQMLQEMGAEEAEKRMADRKKAKLPPVPPDYPEKEWIEAEYGFEGVYEIGKNFRNEGMDRTHNPEFTCMELYVQYKDYNWMMSFTEQLLERICIAVNGTCESVVDGKTINFKAPYRRLPILDAIKEKTGYDLNGKSEDEIRTICKDLNLEIDETMGKGKLIDEIFGEFCEGTFIQPTFIIDYPVEMSPLTKMHRSKPGLTERFELMINGKEVANAYSELNDPIDQEERFKEQLRLSEKGDDEAMFIDQDFLKALQYGMPPTSGIGIGIDRLTMLMTGQAFIQEVLFFPQMRPEKVTPKDAPAKFMELGIPEEWVAVIQKAGYNLVSDMKDVNPQKLHMDICGINKKYKLELANPTVKDVEGWVEKI